MRNVWIDSPTRRALPLPLSRVSPSRPSIMGRRITLFDLQFLPEDCPSSRRANRSTTRGIILDHRAYFNALRRGRKQKTEKQNTEDIPPPPIPSFLLTLHPRIRIRATIVLHTRDANLPQLTHKRRVYPARRIFYTALHRKADDGKERQKRK